MAPDLISSLSLWQEPFMQRALIGGVISGILGGWVGSIAVLRQLSFFAEALGQASLLGISLALLLGLSPPVLLWPFALGFAWLLRELLKRSALSADALLSLMCSGALALSVVLLSSLPGARLSLQQLLFGDILGIAWADLLPLALLLVVTLAYGVISRRAQILISIDPVLARSRGVAVETHRMILLGLLALVVAASIKAVGVLLISGFVVIPACVARLLSRSFNVYVLLASGIGAFSAVLGLFGSAVFNQPSGPMVVLVQALLFVMALLAGRWVAQTTTAASVDRAR